MKIKKQTLLPDQMYVKLKYVDRIAYVDQSIPTVTVTFAANGLFDVDLSNIGHQPLGYDQWSNFYQKYEVLASAIKCNIIAGSGSGNAVRQEITLYPSSQNTVVDLASAREQPFVKHRYMSGGQLNFLQQIKQYITIKKLEARNTASINFSGSTGQAGTGTNPTNLKYWHIRVNTLDVTENVNCYLDVQITYYVKLFRKFSLTGS